MIFSFEQKILHLPAILDLFILDVWVKKLNSTHIHNKVKDLPRIFLGDGSAVKWAVNLFVIELKKDERKDLYVEQHVATKERTIAWNTRFRIMII